MAALLRQGARRIGGSVLQRAQAAVTSPAVAEERRRLLPRRMYSTQEQATEENTRKIQQKKEELYDVICKAEQSFLTSSFRNKLLLQHLSVQVKPRPKDPKWQILRFTKRAVNVVDAAGFIASIYLVCSFVAGVRTFIQERRVARARIFEAVARAREEARKSAQIKAVAKAREAGTRSAQIDN
uniref:Uncharacterized protein n=1 Tax=Avena sativa TaxID=4498 RepID=A0ACD6ACZ5_AVESA